MKKIISIFLAVISVAALFGCSDGKDELPPIVTQGIPEENVRSTVVQNGFTIDIHNTYAEIMAYSGKETVLTLPDSATGVPIKQIGEAAFKGNKTLEKVILPDSMISIDRFAFENCEALTEVVFNEGFERIGDYSFRYSGISKLELPDSVCYIGKYSFYSAKVTSLKIPANVSKLGNYAFYGCTELKSIEFCQRITELGERAFYGCTSLTEVVIPKNIAVIDDYAFSSCSNLSKIVIPSETEKVGEGVFVDCPKLTVYSPSGSETEKNAKRNGYRFETCDYDELASVNG